MNEFSIAANSDTLLITLGDSWTAGVGCYDPVLLERFTKKELGMDILYDASKERFYQKSWASILANRRNFDLLNLAEGGAANSAMFKKFTLRSMILNTSKYRRVIVIFVLSDPARFSFIKYGHPVSWIPNHSTDKIATSYFRDVLVNLDDANIETACYLSGVKQLCDSKGFEFYYASAFTNISDVNRHINFTENNLHEIDHEERISNYLYLIGDSVLAHCGHPNESGYQEIARRFDLLLK